MRRLTDQIRSALPDSLAGRIRWLFAVFAVLVAGLIMLEVALSGAPRWPNRAVGLTGLAVTATWVWAQYRREGLAPLWDVVPISAVFAVGIAMGGPGVLFGLLFVLLFARALYGSARQVAIAATGFLFAYQGAEIVTEGFAALLDVSTVVLLLAVAFSAGIMRLLGDVVGSHERESQRGAVLARMASALQRAEDHDEVYAIGVAATLELLDDVPDAVVAWWRGDPEGLRLEGRGGAVPEDVPTTFPVAGLPEDVRRSLLAGAPFALTEDETIATQQAMGIAPPWFTSCLMVPIGRQEHFGGMLTAAALGPLPTELLPSLERLSADVALALELADRTSLLSQVVDNSSDAILLVDADLRVDFASRAMRSVLGYEPDELRGRSLADLLDTDEHVGQLLHAAAIATERGDPRVLAMRHSDGDLRQIELASSSLPGARRPGWVMNLRDVTQRIDTARELEEGRQRLVTLAESVSDGLYRMVFDPEPHYEYVNPAMERITGVAATEFLADADLVLRHIHPDERDLAELSRTRPDMVAWPVETRWRHPELGWRWLSIHETVIRDASGDPLSTMGIVSDITARKEQEEALHRALGQERRVADELRRVDLMRSTFLQAVSHELRTPLTVILGFSQTLNRNEGRLDPAKRKSLLQGLAMNAERLDRLLSDLLDVDRLATGLVEPVRRRVDVVELCRRVVAQTATASHPVSFAGERVIADVDPSKVERIVANLVANAVKHTPPGTPILVDVTSDDGTDGVVISVEDRGDGIPDELRETIFEPFVQGPASSSSPDPGTGIGLSLVARFAELHGGRAWVEQAPEGGARFAVRLPGQSPPAAEPTPDPPTVG